VRFRFWALALVVTALAACGGNNDSDEQAASQSSALPVTIMTSTAPAPPAIGWTQLENYFPPDRELPDRVVYQGRFDLSNEKAARDSTELQQFQNAGRVSGVQYAFSVEAGARTLSIGISYYTGAAEPKKLLRNSGDPAAHTAPGRFAVTGLGDEYIAQRLKLGTGEASAYVVNLAWVRGNFFVSLADLGGTEDTSTDIAVQMARLIDERIKNNPNP
jgi:hypothetical protein